MNRFPVVSQSRLTAPALADGPSLRVAAHDVKAKEILAKKGAFESSSSGSTSIKEARLSARTATRRRSTGTAMHYEENVWIFSVDDGHSSEYRIEKIRIEGPVGVNP